MKTNPRITKGRIALLLEEPFFGSLLMHLQPIEDSSVKTFCTDGRSLRYNPDFLAKLNDRQLKTVLAHEVLHCALLHPYRRDDRDLRKFNIAADYAINNFLDRYNQEAVARKCAEPFPIQDIGLLNHAFDDLSAEEIYARLIDPPDAGGGSAGNPSVAAGAPGSPSQSPNPLQPSSTSATNPPIQQSTNPPTSVGEFVDAALDKAASDVAEAEWKVALRQATIAAKAQGRLPADAARFVKEFLDPAVPWREILRTFLTSVAKDDYSWSHPNRRYAGSGLILPSMHSPHLGPIVVAIDTSGSINQKQFDSFISEVRAILFDCRPEKLVLAQCDARLHAWQELDPFEDLGEVQFRGGGGTNFCPVFDRALDQAAGPDGPPAALIYLTDLHGTFPDFAPPFPVLWASTTSREAPFGQTIQLQP